LRQPDGTEVETKAALNAKEVVGLYFSAHWCPPCRQFTPVLSKGYTALKAAGTSIEIVFVSSDSDKNAFDEYHASMTFLALPYAERDTKEKLSKMYKVKGIPTLVFLDGATGATITADGREVMSEGDFIKQFPFRPRQINVVEELGPKLRRPDGTVVESKTALQGVEVLGLYFSAHWCPPCQKFTPVLSEKYLALKKAGKKVEIVFVSSDRDQAAFGEYHSHMTFLGLPFELRDAKNSLSKHFKVEGIPALVFVNASTGALITDQGRAEISAASFIEDFPYYPKPVNDLAANLTGIQDEPCLLVLMEGASKEVQRTVSATLKDVAEGELKKPEDQRVIKRFFTGCGGGPIDQIRGKCGYAEVASVPQLLILDLDNEGSYYHPTGAEVTADSIRAFMAQFASKSLKTRTFGQ